MIFKHNTTKTIDCKRIKQPRGQLALLCQKIGSTKEWSASLSMAEVKGSKVVFENARVLLPGTERSRFLGPRDTFVGASRLALNT